MHGVCVCVWGGGGWVGACLKGYTSSALAGIVCHPNNPVTRSCLPVRVCPRFHLDPNQCKLPQTTLHTSTAVPGEGHT